MTLWDYYAPMLLFVVPMAVVGCLGVLTGLATGRHP